MYGKLLERCINEQPKLTSQCKICKEAAAYRHTPYVGDFQKAAVLGAETIRTCLHCGTASLYPLPNKELLLSIYESGTYWDDNQPSKAYAAHVEIQCSLRCARAMRYVAPSIDQLKILDFGAGRGDMASELAKVPKSIEYYFVEPDQAAADVIRSRETDTLKVQEHSNSERIQFDVIFLNQVMEHVNDPIELVRSLGHQLAQHGILYVETPFLDHKFKDEVFPHVYFFNRESYQHIASASQLNLKVAKTFGTEDMIRMPLIHKVFSLFWLKSIQFRISGIAKWLYKKLYFREQDTNPIWVYGIFLEEATGSFTNSKD